MRISDWSSDVCSSDLAAGLVAMVGTVEQVVLILADRGQAVGEGRVDEDMAGRAGAAAAAQRQQFVKAVVADDLHHGKAALRLHRLFFARTVDHDQFRHVPRSLIDRKSTRLNSSN